MSSIITLLNSMAKRRLDERDNQYNIGQDDTFGQVGFDVLWLDDWPNRLGQVNSLSGDTVMQVTNNWEPRTRYHGYQTFPYRLTGFVRDSSGVGVANAVVQLFRTADDVYLRQAISQAGGQYDLGVIDNSTQHYIVAYRHGPDIEGTTVDTLTGA